MARMIRRLATAGMVTGLAVVLGAGAASAQTVTVEFGPIEIIRQGGQMTVEFGPGEIIEEGTRYTFMEGGEMVFELPPAEVIEGSEMIFFLPRQSFTYETTDGGSGGGGGNGGGGGGGGPDCGPDGCGG